MKKLGKGCLLLFLIPFLLVGISMTLWGWNNYKNAKASESWPSTPGVIVTSRMDVDYGNSDDAESKYIAVISYNYKVNTMDYTADRVFFDSHSYLKKIQADKIISRYPVGKKVNVYYNSSKPHMAVLEPGSAAGAGYALIFGIVMLLMSSIVMFMIFGKKKKAADREEVSKESISAKEETPVEYRSLEPGPQAASTSSSQKVPFILTIGMFVAAALFLVWGTSEFISAKSSSDWPSVKGKITSSTIRKEYRRSGSSSTSRAYFYPAVRYAYPVNGKTYSSTRISFGGETGYQRRSKAKKIVDQHPVGNTVTVNYDPKDPGKVVLEVGLSWRDFMPLIGGLCFLVVGILCLRSYSPSRKSTTIG